MSAKKTETVMTSAEGTVKTVTVKGKKEIYFHPGSGTLLFVEASDQLQLQGEHNFLNSLLEERIKAREEADQAEELFYSPLSVQSPQAKSKLEKAYERLNNAAEKLRNVLSVITPNVSEGVLLDENSASSALGLMELLPLGGKLHGMKKTKPIYVRSNKIKSSMRKYKMSKVDNKKGEASFIRYQAIKVVDKQATAATGETQYKTVRKSSIDTKKLKKQLQDASVNVKLEIGKLDDKERILTSWAEEMNKKLIYPRIQGEDEEKQLEEEGFYTGYVDVSAQAQLMRYSRGAGASAEFNPLSGQAKVRMGGNASFALGEAKAQLVTYPLGKRGVNLSLPASGGGNKFCDMGTIRFVLGLHSFPDSEPEVVTEQGLLAGREKSDFKALAKLDLGMTVQAGVGGSAVFYASYIRGRFRLYCKAAFCWGAGAKGSLGFEVDANHVYQFTKCFMFMLRNADYHQLKQIMAEEAFIALAAMPILTAIQGAVILYDSIEIFTTKVEIYLEEHKNRVALMNSINSNPDQLKYTPPETKGSIIANLIDINFLDRKDSASNRAATDETYATPLSRRKEAVMNCLKWVQSKRDYENVMQHFNKIPGSAKSNWKESEAKLIAFLSSGETEIMDPRLYIFSKRSHYAEQPKKIYKWLPITEQIESRKAFRPVPNQLLKGGVNVSGG